MKKVLIRSPKSSKTYSNSFREKQTGRIYSTSNTEENGIFFPENADYFKEFSVNLKFGGKKITSNGIYDLSQDSLKGFSTIEVELNKESIRITPSRERQTFIPEKDYVFSNVLLETAAGLFNLENIEINESGTYTVSDGYDGIGKVSANIFEGKKLISEIIDTGWKLEPTVELKNSNVKYIKDATLYNDAYIGPFVENMQVKEIDFPKCSYIGSYAFYSASIKSVNAPECSDIGSYAFAKCRLLETASFGECQEIQPYTFSGCYKLQSANFSMCSRVRTLAFGYCGALSSISFPKCSVIYEGAFSNCSSLTSLYLPECQNIYNSAFYNCSKLASIDLPECIGISYKAFGNCDSLKSIYLPKAERVGGFAYCNYLSSVSLPECTHLGGNAFESCVSLSSIYLPKCNIIESKAFSNCTNLSEINFPECTYVYESAFYNCYSLKTISLPKCEYIDTSAFYNCSNIVSIDLPECTEVANSAFYKCSNLKYVDLGNCSLIRTNAFDFTNLTTLYLRLSTSTVHFTRDAFENSPLGTAGSGGTIYVPSKYLDYYKSKFWGTGLTEKFKGI